MNVKEVNLMSQEKETESERFLVQHESCKF